MRKITLLLVDIILLYLSLAITLRIRFGYIDQELLLKHIGPFTIIFGIWIIVFFINGLYEIRKVKNDFKFYGQLIQNLVINALIAIVFFYSILGRFSSLKPQTILILLLLVFTTLFLLWRRIFYNIISSKKLGNNLAIIGINPESLLLAEEIITKPYLGYKLRLIINPDYSEIPERFQIIPTNKDIADLKKQFKGHKINTVVTVNNPKYSPEVAKYLFDSIDLKIQYFNLTDFYEKITGKIPVTVLERHWFLENITQKNNDWFIVTKRIIDILFSVILGILSLLIIPIVSLAIKLESKGPLIYKQKRIGLHG